MRLLRLNEYVATPAKSEVSNAMSPNDTSVRARSPSLAGANSRVPGARTAQVLPIPAPFPPGGSQKGEESDPPGGKPPDHEYRTAI
jgi:hypothetical protein